MTLDELKALTIQDDNGCWLWTRSCHVLAYTLSNGPVPEGHIIRHACHVPRCCNPDHLISGTHQDNWSDSEDAHRAQHRERSSTWNVDGVNYSCVRDAVKGSGVSMNSIIKFTKDGVFDVDEYRAACSIAGWIPKL